MAATEETAPKRERSDEMACFLDGLVNTTPHDIHLYEGVGETPRLLATIPKSTVTVRATSKKQSRLGAVCEGHKDDCPVPVVSPQEFNGLEGIAELRALIKERDAPVTGILVNMVVGDFLDKTFRNISFEVFKRLYHMDQRQGFLIYAPDSGPQSAVRDGNRLLGVTRLVRYRVIL